MLAIFQYAFIWRAIWAGLLVGGVSPIIGIFLVSKRYSLIADTLAHLALSGVVIGLWIGVYPMITATIVAVVMAVLIEWLRSKNKMAGELSLAIFMSGGLALAAVMIGLSGGFSIDLESYLFGNILLVGEFDLYSMTFLAAVVVILLWIFRRQFKAIAFDEELAMISGIRVEKLNILLMILTALVVSLAMKMVGGLLIGALMIVPVVTAMLFKKSFSKTIALSVILALVTVLIGLFLAFSFDLASGGIIVLTAIAVFVLANIWVKMG